MAKVNVDPKWLGCLLEGDDLVLTCTTITSLDPP